MGGAPSQMEPHPPQVMRPSPHGGSRRLAAKKCWAIFTSDALLPWTK
jgi:hypothetical protein